MDRETRNIVIVVLAGALAALSTRDVVLASIVVAVTGVAVLSFLIAKRWSTGE